LSTIQKENWFFYLQDIKRPSVLYTEVVEVDCRVIPALEDRCQMDKPKDWVKVTGTTGEKMLIIKELDEEAVRKDLVKLREKGIESIAVVLAHSYTYHEHELRIGKIASDVGKCIFNSLIVFLAIKNV
jgi:5-oxoprolinase (ATP-hydrolysing)